MSLLAVAGCAPSAGGRAAGLMFVVTQVPAGSGGLRKASRLDLDGRYPLGSRVALVFAGARPGDVRVLSAGLASAGAPAVSPDGRRVLFAGRESAESRWAIFEVNLRAVWGRPRKAADLGMDCADPAYLAGEGIVFSCGHKRGPWSLYSASLKTGGVERITFGPGDAFDPAPLRDGRLLFSWADLASGRPAAALFVVNQDGTWVEAFAAAHPRDSFARRGRRTRDSGVVFVSGDAGSHGRIERVEMRRPMVRRRALATGLSDARSAEPLPDGALLLAGRSTQDGVFRWREGGRLEPLFADPRFTAAEAVPVAASGPLKGRPSTVDMARGSGTLLCYDSNQSDGVVGPHRGSPKAARVEFLAWKDGVEAPLGWSAVESDGSFLVEAPADLPIRVRTRDFRSRAVSTCGWFWVRSGEVRSCIGCHEGHERMATNRLIKALRHDARRLSPMERRDRP